jgi:hypothetical protein
LRPRKHMTDLTCIRGVNVALPFDMNANESQRRRIEDLKERVRDVMGEAPTFAAMEGISADVQEAFLKQVLEFETTEPRTIFSALKDDGVVLPNPDELDDAQLTLKLWEVIHSLVNLGVFLHCTDHLSDRELYSVLWTDLLLEPVVLRPQDPDYAYHIDLVGSGSDEHLQLYLKYYADESERALYARDFPDLHIPEHCDAPHDRDRRLPGD